MSKNKKALVALKKANTSLAKIIEMVDKDEYCIDILQQILAVKGLLNSASGKIMQDHLNHCFSAGIRTNDSKVEEKLIKELMGVINLYDKSK